MFTQPKVCPNAECGATGKFFIKKGYFKTKWNAQPVPRYRCKRYSGHLTLLRNKKHHSQKTKTKMRKTAKKLNRYKDLLKSIEKNKRKVIDSIGNIFNSMLECSKYHNISIQTVCDILKGRHSKTRKGVSFKYYE